MAYRPAKKKAAIRRTCRAFGDIARGTCGLRLELLDHSFTAVHAVNSCPSSTRSRSLPIPGSGLHRPVDQLVVATAFVTPPLQPSSSRAFMTPSAAAASTLCRPHNRCVCMTAHSGHAPTSCTFGSAYRCQQEPASILDRSTEALLPDYEIVEASDGQGWLSTDLGGLIAWCSNSPSLMNRASRHWSS
jgi:hypothetical protein